jgi:hypothetical protein
LASGGPPVQERSFSCCCGKQSLNSWFKIHPSIKYTQSLVWVRRTIQFLLKKMPSEGLVEWLKW